jgi:hypothetical protein
MLRLALRRWTAASIVLTLAALLCGCNSLPKDWPIKELTLPPNSHKAEVPHRINDLRATLSQLPQVDKQMGKGKPKWVVAFNAEGGWDAVVNHVGGKLTAAGYTGWEPSQGWQGGDLLSSLTGASKLDEAAHIYKNPDAPYTVVLLNVQNMATKLSEGANEEGDFVIDIWETAAPAS